MKHRILFILPTLHAGGAENYALRFIQYCGIEQLDWHVLSPNVTRGDLHDAFLQAGCTLHYQSIGYFNIFKFRRFFKLLKQYKFDSICTFNGNFGGVPLLIARMVGIRKRIAWHRRSTNAFGENQFKLWYNAGANRLIRGNATDILSNSAYALNNFYGSYWKNDDRFVIIPNGIEAGKFKIEKSKLEIRKEMGLPLDGFIIGHVGRYDVAKNHETIFKVAAEIKKKNSNVYFLFCGKNTDSDAFSNRLRKHEIEDICCCLGLSNNLPYVYKSLDLFYFPSITEGQPNALIEAMVAGIPVLPSDIPPILECIPPNASHQTVPPSDVNGSVSKISAIIKDANRGMDCIFQSWAEKYFEARKNFNLFLNELK